ncbi:unnamed protein product [Laminaria digitata]
MDEMHGTFQKPLHALRSLSCSGCRERWHTGVQIADTTVYLCNQCKRDKKVPKAFSDVNHMDPGNIPPQLQGLTQVEQMLIARACAIMRVYRLKGAQRGFGGHVVNVAQDVQEFATSLPRLAADLSVLIVLRQGADQDTHNDFVARRSRVEGALRWLRDNNPFYRDIVLDENAFSRSPQHGSNDESSESNAGPEQGGASGGGEVSESYLRSGEETAMLEDAAIESMLQGSLRIDRQSNQRRKPVARPNMEGTPLNEFKTPVLATMAFPSLFPYGKGDTTNPARRRAVSPTEGFRHLLKYYTQGATGAGCYRFASHPQFPHWAHNMLQRHRLLSQVSVYLKHAEADAALTIEQLQAIMKAGGEEAKTTHGAHVSIRGQPYRVAPVLVCSDAGTPGHLRHERLRHAVFHPLRR